MEKYDIYKDISERTGGDIFVGVVGPVRTGKSTFVSKFLENVVMPNISNKLQKQITHDELPQSADGKIIMTTQPKFIPGNAIKVQFKNKITANVRLVDCVGYLVEGALGHEEDNKPRNVKTPWDDNEIPFEKAAEIGTKKVIDEYSTIGVVVTTDGSFGDIPRENYVQAEERIINELKCIGRPFIVVLNSKNPNSEKTIKLASELEENYGVTVVSVNVLEMTKDDINLLMERILLEFPLNVVNLDLPKWMRALPQNSSIINELIDVVKENSKNIKKMKDFAVFDDLFENSENYNSVELGELKLGEGCADFKVCPKDGLFYKTLSEACGESINDDYELMSYIKGFSEYKKKFSKIKDALEQAENDGYGVVVPSLEELKLD